MTIMMCTQESSPEAASATTLQVVENSPDAAATSTGECETSAQDHAAAAVVVVTESEESDMSEDEQDAACDDSVVQSSEVSINNKVNNNNNNNNNNKVNNQPINPIQQEKEEEESSGDEYSSSDDDEKGEEASSSSECSDDEGDNNIYSATPAPAPAPALTPAPIPAPTTTTTTPPPQPIAPPGPMYIYDAAKDPELEAKNIILAVLTHGAKCQVRGRCPFPNCTQAKAMVRHVARCPELNNACGMSYCANAKFVLRFAPQIQAGILQVARYKAANDPFVMRMRAAALAAAAAGSGGKNAVSARRAAPRRQFSSTMPRWTSRTLETIQEGEQEEEDSDDDDSSDDDSSSDDESDNHHRATLANNAKAMTTANTIRTDEAKGETNEEDGSDESDSSGEESDDGQVSTQPTNGKEDKKAVANGNIQTEASTKSKGSNWVIEYSDDESDDEGSPRQSAFQPSQKPRLSASSDTSSKWEIEYSDEEESDDKADAAEMKAQKQGPIECSDEGEPDNDVSPQKSTIPPTLKPSISAASVTSSNWEIEYSDDEESDDEADEAQRAAQKQATIEYSDDEESDDEDAMTAQRQASSDEENRKPPELQDCPAPQESCCEVKPGVEGQLAMDLPTVFLKDPQDDEASYSNDTSKEMLISGVNEAENEKVLAVENLPIEAQTTCKMQDQEKVSGELGTSEDKQHPTPDFQAPDDSKPNTEHSADYKESKEENEVLPKPFGAPRLQESLAVLEFAEKQQKAINLPQGDTGSSSSPLGADATDAHLAGRDDDNDSKASSGDGGYITADSVFSSFGDISSDDDDNYVDSFEDREVECALRSEPQSTSDGSVLGENPRSEMVPSVPLPVPQMVVDNATAEPAQDGVSSTTDVNEGTLLMDNKHEAIETDCGPSGVHRELFYNSRDLPLGPDGIGLAEQEGIEKAKKPESSEGISRTRDGGNTDTPSAQERNDPDMAVPIVFTDSSARESDAVNDLLKAATEDREETLVEGSISDLCHRGVHDPHEEGDDSVRSLVLQTFSGTAENAKNVIMEGAEDVSVSAIAWKSFVFEESSSLLRWDPASSGAPADFQDGSNSGMQGVYQNVRYCKMVGFLSLASAGIRFVFSGHHAMDLDRLDPLTISWSEVVKQQQSPPPYAFLKFLLTNGKAHTFQFDGRESLEDVISDAKKCLMAHRSKQNEKPPDIVADQVPGDNNSKMELDKSRFDIAHEDNCFVAGEFKKATKVDQEMATRKKEENILRPVDNSDEDAVASSACDHEIKDNRFRLNDSKSQTPEVMASNHIGTRATTGSGNCKAVNRDTDLSTPVSRTQTDTCEVDEVIHSARKTAEVVDCPGKDCTNLKKAEAASVLSCGSDRGSSTLYSPVYFKSVEGSLSVNENNLRFESSKEENGKYITKTLPYKNIAKHQKSPQKVAKSMLKVVSTEGKAVTFEVRDRDVLEKIAKEVTEHRRAHQAKTQNKESTNSTLPSPAGSSSSADVVKVGWQKVGGSKQNRTSLSLHVFDGVDFKGARGSIHLATDSFCFLPSSDQDSIEGSTTIPWKDVSKHQGSPKTHAKALVNLVLSNGKSMAFELKSRDELTQLRKIISSLMTEARARHNRSDTATSTEKGGNEHALKKKGRENAETQSSSTERPDDRVTCKDLAAPDVARNDAKGANDGRQEENFSMPNQPAGRPKMPDKREKSLTRIGIGVVKKLKRSLSWKKPSK